MPLEIVFPAGSVGARTPDAPEFEPWGLTSFGRPVRPATEVDVEDPAWQLNRPLQGRAGWCFELEDGLLQNKSVCCWRSRFINGRSVVVKASIGP